jgi:regulator of cell morphogenesis and NO signaling
MDARPTSPLEQRTLGELVSENPRTAAVFDGIGLDYCCRGHQTLAEAIASRGLPLPAVLEAIGAAGQPTADEQSIADLELDDLTRHIVSRHHQYIRDMSPAISAWLDKLVARHGTRHPELAEIRLKFLALNEELTAHMMKEEHILFPFIDELAAARRSGARLPRGPFGTVLNPVRVMEHDHRQVGDLMAELRAATGGFTPPADACRTYQLCFAELANFEQDLHKHIHLENNVLFPQAVEIEAALM